MIVSPLTSGATPRRRQAHWVAHQDIVFKGANPLRGRTWINLEFLYISLLAKYRSQRK